MYALNGYIENMPLHVFAMKEKDNVMMLMSTYEKNEQVGEKFSVLFVGRG